MSPLTGMELTASQNGAEQRKQTVVNEGIGMRSDGQSQGRGHQLQAVMFKLRPET